MNFSDMLKKKKSPEENIQNSESSEQTDFQPTEVLDEIEQVNAARLNTKEEIEPDGSSELDKLKAEVAEANDKYLRLYAEFDNYKRRTTKERIELQQTAGKDILISLLPVLDDFERASKAIETASEIAPVKEGVSLVHHKLRNIVQQKGVKEMQSIGQTFDPEIHEAITNIPSPTEDMKGKVIDEVEKGYYLNDKVIRFAKVVVGA